VDYVRLGVLDIGSNTVHLLIVDAHKGGAPVPAVSHKKELRLAEQMNRAGEITADAVADLQQFVRDSLQVAEDMGVTEVVAFATSAIRGAGNGGEVLAGVAAETGVDVAMLTGDEEARLTFLAARRWFGWSSGRLLLIDIGGGSLEMAVGSDEFPDAAYSLEVGAGRLTARFIDSDPPEESAIRQMRKSVRAEIGGVVGGLRRGGDPRHAVATSKTLRQLARITGAAPSSEGPFVRRHLVREDLRQWVPKLATMSDAERRRLPGVSVGRSAQLLAGAIVAEAAMDLLDLAELEVCPWALREGIILQRLDRLP
jgi:exopolyphosphatase/guanosine-5'-triphosphate,3'-diphosphate pyrophosphatase